MPQPFFLLGYQETGETTTRSLGICVESQLRGYYLDTPQTPKQEPPKDITRKGLYETYISGHKMWWPKIKLDDLASLLRTGIEPTRPRTYSPPLNNEAFINYYHTTNILGEVPLPPLIHHTACNADDKIYLLGGCTVLHDPGNPNKKIDLSNYVVKGIKLPLPISSDLLNSPLVIPNNHLFILSPVTNRVIRAKVSGESPPPLLCMSSSQITKRHIFYYGGFEIINRAYESDGVVIIQKDIQLNNHGYVLDVISLKFRKFELTAHPNPTNRYPLTVPRFGHTSTTLKTTSKPAAVYIMGGYRQTDEADGFEAIQDLWKVELSIVYEGDNDYVEFGDIALATPISSPGPPLARAFHGADVHESSIVFHGGTNGSVVYGDVWIFNHLSESWTELVTSFMGSRAQVKRVAHQGVILDNYFLPLVGAIPSDFAVTTDNDSVLDISMIHRTSRAENVSSVNSLFYWMHCLNLLTGEWFMERVYHDYYLPVVGRENEISGTGNIGSTITMGNSRTFLIGGALTVNFGLDITIMNSGLGSYEFPLGCSTGITRSVQ